MLEEFISNFDVTTSLVFVLVFLLVMRLTNRPPDIPPGPSLLFPLLGNIPSLIGRDVLCVFRQMRQKYGDIFSVYVGNQIIVVINGYSAIKEALVKRGNMFSERPKNFLSEDVKLGMGLIFVSGSLWKEQRRFTVNALQELGFGRTSFEKNIQDEIITLLALIDHQQGKPFDIKPFLQTSVSNVMCGIVFGKMFDHDDQEFQKFLRYAEECSVLIGNASGLLNCFPFLKFLPGDPLSTKKILQYRDEFIEYFTKICDEHVKTFDPNTTRDFVDMYIAELMKQKATGTENSFSKAQMIQLLGDLFGAGSETTATTIRWSLLYLVRHPGVVKRIQEDLDQIVGMERLPCLADRKHLPYLEATIFEVLRISTVAPLAVPHAVSNDIIFKGYRIPSKSTIIINLESIFKDSELWQNPDTFDPERFLSRDGNIQKPEEFIPFSIGRRVCLGESVARMELFLFLSAMLQRFEFRLPEGAPPPDPVGIMGATYMPKQFEIVAVKRLN